MLREAAKGYDLSPGTVSHGHVKACHPLLVVIAGIATFQFTESARNSAAPRPRRHHAATPSALPGDLHSRMSCRRPSACLPAVASSLLGMPPALPAGFFEDNEDGLFACFLPVFVAPDFGRYRTGGMADERAAKRQRTAAMAETQTLWSQIG